MKHCFICILLLLPAMTVYTQSVSYSYDNAGNRTARAILLKAPQAPNAPEAVTALSDLISERAILIYPNPTKGILSVEIKDYTDKLQAGFRLTDLSGRTIIEQRATTSIQTIDLSRQAAGVYLLQIRINDESATWKVVKE